MVTSLSSAFGPHRDGRRTHFPCTKSVRERANIGSRERQGRSAYLGKPLRIPRIVTWFTKASRASLQSYLRPPSLPARHLQRDPIVLAEIESAASAIEAPFALQTPFRTSRFTPAIKRRSNNDANRGEKRPMLGSRDRWMINVADRVTRASFRTLITRPNE